MSFQKNILQRPFVLALLVIGMSAAIFDLTPSSPSEHQAIRRSMVTGNMVVREPFDMRSVVRQFQFFSKATEAYLYGSTGY